MNGYGDGGSFKKYAITWRISFDANSKFMSGNNRKERESQENWFFTFFVETPEKSVVYHDVKTVDKHEPIYERGAKCLSDRANESIAFCEIKWTCRTLD